MVSSRGVEVTDELLIRAETYHTQLVGGITSGTSPSEQYQESLAASIASVAVREAFAEAIVKRSTRLMLKQLVETISSDMTIEQLTLAYDRMAWLDITKAQDLIGYNPPPGILTNIAKAREEK